MNNSNCVNPQYLSQLENDFSNSVELDKTLLIQRFSPNSSKQVFMFLNQFKSTQPVPTKLFWGRKQVESDVLISETFNQYFASFSACFFPFIIHYTILCLAQFLENCIHHSCFQIWFSL